MSSVTARVEEVKQPRGGYLKPSLFEVFVRDDGIELFEEENINPGLVGTVVDYLTRYKQMNGFKKVSGVAEIDALFGTFTLCLEGAEIAEKVGKKGSFEEAQELLKGITSKNVETAITSACKLATYDLWKRNPLIAMTRSGTEDINPNQETIRNIAVMVKRGLDFFKDYGPVIESGFTFEEKGYTEIVDSGDGDYLTKDTLWDFKVLRSRITSKHTLQLLMYWIMGRHSGQAAFKSISNLGFFNPRQNTVHLLDAEKIPEDVIAIVERDVICY